MKKHFPNISVFVLTAILIFAVSGFLLPQTVHAEILDVLLNPLTWPAKALGAIAYIILQFISLLTGLGGVVLNGVIYYTVGQMSVNYTGLTSINTTWGTIRDLANMGFIFILLYAAIQTILGIGSDTQKLIRNIIIVAILINFSLFFTKIIIDISNILAIFFYDAIAPGALNVSGLGAALTQNGITNTFMNAMNLQSLFNVKGLGEIPEIITIGLMGSIMLLIAAFVFFAAAIMFVIRYVILILVIILSPLAFMGFVMPQLGKYKDQWWNALSGQAFFAPIYFMLIWVSLQVVTGIGSSLRGGTPVATTDALSGIATVNTAGLSAGAFAMFINFIVVIVFLIASLLIAKNWANRAGPAATGLTKWAMGAAGGASFGLAGRAGRYTLGATAEAFKESKAYKRLEAASPNSRLARLTLATADKTRTSSFDVRGSRLGGVLAGAGLEAGQAGGQGGVEAERKRVEEFLERPGTESRKKRIERARKAQGELDILAGLAPATIPAGARTPQQQVAVDAMERAIANSSDKEIEAIVDSNRRLLQNQEFANRISVKQLEALNKSDKFTEAEKDTLKGARFSAINNPAGLAALAVPQAARTPAQTAAANTISGAIRNLSDTELEMINPTHLGSPHFVASMRSSQVDSVIKSTKFTTAQKDNLRGARRQPLINAIATGGPTAAADTQAALRRLGAKEVAGLINVPGPSGVNLAFEPLVLQAYTPQMLKRIASEISPTDIQNLRTAILGVGGPTATWLATPAGQTEFS